MRAKLFNLLLLGLISTSLMGCFSFSDYVKTRKFQYLTSQNLPPLKLPPGIQVPREERYVIPPRASNSKSIQFPDLQPPTS